MKTLYICILCLLVSFGLNGQKGGSENYATLQQNLKDARLKKDNIALGNAYFAIGKYEEEVNFDSELAFENYIIAKQYYDKENMSQQSAEINWIIAKRYAQSEFYPDAIYYYTEKLLPFYKNSPSKTAKLYFELGQLYAKQGAADQSLACLNQSLKINQTLKDTTLLMEYNFQRIENHLRLKEVDSCFIIASKMVDMASKTKDYRRLSQSLYYIGLTNLRIHKLDLAIKYLVKSQEALPYAPFDIQRRDVLKRLSQAHDLKKEYKASYHYLQQFVDLNDSIHSQEKLKRINDLTIKHKSEENVKRNRMLEIEKASLEEKSIFQRNAFYFVAIGFFMLLFGTYFLMRYYTQKMKVDKIINDQNHEIDSQHIRELESKVKINGMQSMIIGQEKERERLAKDLHDALGGLLSTVKLQFDQLKPKITVDESKAQYNKASDLLDFAIEEVRTISRNLQPVALKNLGLLPALNDLISKIKTDDTPEVFFQHYDIPDNIDQIISLNIYRIIQELINNSIKHGHPSEILIQINYTENEFIIDYEDDGKGFDPNTLESTGMGLDNIYSRVTFLKGTISINSQIGQGISVFIRIPNEKI